MAFKLGDRLTELDYRREIVCIAPVVAVFKHFVRLKNGKEWRHDGWPRGASGAYYRGAKVRLEEPGDMESIRRQIAKMRIKAATDEQLDKLCTEDLEVVVAILKKGKDA